ncbi:MAG TPA: lipopolysaccharide biosynthesis protein [Candidatus Sulfotelmatobacter sp.]|nr:lipopolysaccharide biosynthesis protein [Candidatus Sulfotelmatobacter sp.]
MESEQSLALKPELDAMAGAAEPDPSPTKARDRSMLSSIAWNAASDWISQIITWTLFLVVLRILSPADFGLLALQVVLMPLGYTSSLGIGRAIVTLRDLTEDQISQLNTVGLMLGLGSYALAAAAAVPVARFYKLPALIPVILISSLGMIVGGAQLVSNGLMMKEMRFRALCTFNAISAVSASVFTFLFAWIGWKYWALIAGGMIGGAVRAALVFWSRPHAYAWPRWKSVRHPIAFGRNCVVSTAASDIYESLDNFTAGRVLGPGALGLYGMAWTLANLPMEKVTSMVTMVISGYLAEVKDDLAALRRYIRNLSESIALLTFPGCVGLGLVAHEFVPVVLGKKWLGMEGPLQVLSIYAGLRSVVALIPKLIVSMGNSRFVMWVDLVTLPVLGVAFYIGSHWGITGIAWGWVVAYPWVVLPLYRKAFASIHMGIVEYLRPLRPAVEGTIVMTIAVLSVRHALPGNWLVPVRLTVEVLTGVLFYAAILWLRHRERMLAFVQLIMSARRR